MWKTETVVCEVHENGGTAKQQQVQKGDVS